VPLASDAQSQRSGGNQKRAAREFGEGTLNTLKQANQLWRDHRAGKADGEAFRQQGQEIEDQPTHQLRHRQLTGPDNQRLLDGIGRQNDPGRVLRFRSGKPWRSGPIQD
jgi:hypothetical protein